MNNDKSVDKLRNKMHRYQCLLNLFLILLVLISSFLCSPLSKSSNPPVVRALQVIQYFGFLCVSVLLALVVNLLIESPFLRLEELLFHPEPMKEEGNGHTNVAFENGGPMNKMTSMEMTTLENGLENRIENRTENRIENTEFYRRNIED